MAKRKTKKRQSKRTSRKNQKLNLKFINLLLVLIILLMIIISFLLFNYDTKQFKKSKEEISNKIEKNIKKNIHKIDKSKDELVKYFDEFEVKENDFEEYTKEFYKDYVHPPHEKKEKKEKKPEVKDKVIVKKAKPMLSIVIDDVTTQYQVNKIRKLGYKTTISIMPPTPRHPHSAEIAVNLPFYIIHLPMEAKNFKKEEKNTLHTLDSYEKIEKRIQQIRKWYPDARFTNNHTGSKFTENEKAMDKLFKALKKYDFTFVDSRTTGKSVAKKIAQKYDMPYIVRNVFLDNEQKFNYIQNQLKKAIHIAKKNGHAIAICHPHEMTLKVLKESKHLLEGLDLVYLNQLPEAN